MTQYSPFLQTIGYNFKNNKLLREALTHPSCLGDNTLSTKNSYERLEFLGDAVLSFIITELLIKNFPDETEGNLTKRRATLVNSEMLILVGEEIKILDYLTAVGIEKFNKAETLKVIEDATEALLGAIYLDGGIRNCRKFIMKYWQDFLFKKILPEEDSKTYLQEWSQKRGLGVPEYILVSKSGEDHAPIFEMAVKIKGLPEFTATSYSKKIAKKEAAKALIKYIKLNYKAK
ncbi:MAG: ribonuclease III [Rickettsiales bacterium]|nr:ribonuclease III [Rickettsiales bacterium]